MKPPLEAETHLKQEVPLRKPPLQAETLVNGSEFHFGHQVSGLPMAGTCPVL